MYAVTVDYKEDGSIWVYYYDQKIDITDQFKDGVCYVQVSNETYCLCCHCSLKFCFFLHNDHPFFLQRYFAGGL